MKSKVQQPKLGSIALGTLQDGDPDSLVPRTELHSARFSELTLDELELANAHLDGVHFDGLSADRATLAGASLTEAVLARVNVPVLDAPRSRWTDVEISGRIGAFTAYESSLRSIHFIGCKLSFVNLRASDLLDVAFTDCSIEELDLGGAKCRRVQLTNTQIGTLDVRQAKLVDVDLRGADLRKIAGLEHLRGATVTPDQVAMLAPLFAEHMGLNTENAPRA